MTAKWKRIVPPLTTAVIFYFIFRRIPFARLLEALALADYGPFLLLMLPNGLLYFAWDTLVLAVLMRWFHGPIRYAELLPVRAVTYAVSFLNTNLARAATAFYLTRKLQTPFFEIAGTVIFLSVVELTHLALWATAGMALYPARVPPAAWWVPAGFGLFWLVVLPYARRGIAPWRAPLAALGRRFPRWQGRGTVRNWAVFRTFAIAPLRRYVQIILLRAPLFAASLAFHYFAVRTFGMEIPFLHLVAFLPVIFMLAALPVTVAHLGTTQAAWIFFFKDVAPESRLLAYSLSSHLVFMLARGGLGVVFLPRAYRELFGPITWGQFFTAKQPLHPAPSSEPTA
jgi:hypothetical protein